MWCSVLWIMWSNVLWIMWCNVLWIMWCNVLWIMWCNITLYNTNKNYHKHRHKKKVENMSTSDKRKWLINRNQIPGPYLPRETQANRGHSFTPNSSWGYFNIPTFEEEAEGEKEVEVEREEEDKYFATFTAHNSAWDSARWALRTVAYIHI